MPKIYIITGEPSGDILASRLMAALDERLPGVSFAGVGGETMRASGFRSLFPMDELSVMGFWEVAPRLPLIMRRIREVVADIEAQRPDVVVTVDSWGFVSSVLKRLKKKHLDIPVVHYVAPQVWAWKKGRAASVARLADRLMTLWPWEPPLFERHGLRCDFVGHPVIENTAGLAADPGAFRTRHAIPENSTLLCVLPGSRHGEVVRLAPILRRVVARLAVHYPDLFVVIPSVDALAGEVERAFAPMPTPHIVVGGQRERYDAFGACRFAAAASGTVTLELAACGAPHLIAYRFSWLTDRLVRLVVTTRYADLINILAGREIVPEFVLGNCRPGPIYEKALEYMRDPALSRRQTEQAAECLAQLKPPGMMPSEKAAAVVIDVLRTAASAERAGRCGDTE